jgi:hypothetical protein
MGCQGGENGAGYSLAVKQQFHHLGCQRCFKHAKQRRVPAVGSPSQVAASSDAAILQYVPKNVQKLAGQLVRKWWKPHGLPEALRHLEAANAMTISDVDS